MRKHRSLGAREATPPPRNVGVSRSVGGRGPGTFPGRQSLRAETPGPVDRGEYKASVFETPANGHMTDAYVGIDVACAKKKRLPIVICIWDDAYLLPISLKKVSQLKPPCGSGNRVAALQPDRVRQFATDALRYVEAVALVENLHIARVGIDAPSAPRQGDKPRRAAEIALDRAGIRCFTTPSETEFHCHIVEKVRRHVATGGSESCLPHANQLWMLVGFELYRVFKEVAECREVFPQAIVRALGVGTVHKVEAGGVEEQVAAVRLQTGWPVDNGVEALRHICYGPLHDALDAYLCAWVAALPDQQLEAYGEPPDDVIWVPKLGEPGEGEGTVGREPHGRRANPPKDRRRHSAAATHTINRAVPVVINDTTRAGDVVHCRVLCPACDDKILERWPVGWDSHAAHKCAGLTATDPAARKREFKLRFQRLFR